MAQAKADHQGQSDGQEIEKVAHACDPLLLARKKSESYTVHAPQLEHHQCTAVYEHELAQNIDAHANGRGVNVIEDAK